MYIPIDIQNLIYMGLQAKTSTFNKVSLKKELTANYIRQ